MDGRRGVWQAVHFGGSGGGGGGVSVRAVVAALGWEAFRRGWACWWVVDVGAVVVVVLKLVRRSSEGEEYRVEIIWRRFWGLRVRGWAFRRRRFMILRGGGVREVEELDVPVSLAVVGGVLVEMLGLLERCLREDLRAFRGLMGDISLRVL